jgi:hypothetical protein
VIPLHRRPTPPRDRVSAVQVLFLAQGMSQNDVVFDVLSGIADAGSLPQLLGPTRAREACQGQ